MRGYVFRRDIPAVREHRIAHDGQTQSHSTRSGSARIVHPIKRLEHQGKGIFRNSGTIVPDGNKRYAILLAQSNLDLSAPAGIKDRIAHEIFDRAAQQSSIAIHLDVTLALERYGRIGCCGFKIGIVEHVVNDVVQRQTFESRLVLSTLDRESTR